MEFGCSVCEYTSHKKEHVLKHINKKKSCGSGIKELIEIPIEILCQYCNKNFSCSTSLKYHIKNNCKHKDDAKDAKIKELEKELKESRKIINNIDNSNNTNNYIIVVNNYEDTSLDKLTDKIYNKIFRDSQESYKLIPNIIKHIHFNPDMPENHNIYISNRNKNNKHLSVYRNGHWEIENKDNEINNLISDKETNISDWINKKGESYPKAKEIYDEYNDQKYDGDTSKLMREEVEYILYNGKDIIKNR
jgi:hypothetical protein